MSGEPPEAQLHDLHASFEELDPTGRHGAPMTEVERRFDALPEDEKPELRRLLGKPSKLDAVMLWRRLTGEPLEEARASVAQLSRMPWVTRR